MENRDAPRVDSLVGLDDPRVVAALSVLGGLPPGQVAAQLGVEVELVERWAAGFLDAGVSAVTNRPTSREADARDRLLAAISHELRTPVTILGGWLELMLEAAACGPDDRGSEAIRANLSRLQELVNRLASTSEVMLGRTALRRTSAPVEDVLPQPPVEYPPEQVRIDVDVDRMRAALADLEEVAGTADGTSSLAWSVCAAGRWVELGLRRKGTPLERSRVDALLEPFELRDDHSDITFGLFFTRAMIAAHGGQLGVDGAIDGERFWVRLPACSSTNRDRLPSGEDDDVLIRLR